MDSRRTAIASRSPATIACLVAAGTALLAPTPAAAYIGPALGLGVVGTVVTVIVVVMLSLLSFVVLPLRRLRDRLRRRRSRDPAGRRRE